MPPAGDDPHHFDFDLDRGIRAQVVEKLESSPRLPLVKGVGPEASGIYALYFKDPLGLHRQSVERDHQEQANVARSPQ